MRLTSKRDTLSILYQQGLAIFAAAAMAVMGALAVQADAPPVRIAVVPGGGSGVEQEVVDQISNQLQNMDGVALSTVNPDWYVVCNIKENMDQMSGQIRYNGNVLVKTTDGHVISTVAVQKYNQDFSLSPGTPLNKALVDRAARDVISNLANRAVAPIQQAVQVEMEGRSRIDEASQLAAQDKFDQALGIIEQITPDFAHFDAVKKMHDQLMLEKQCKVWFDDARAKQKAGRYVEAIALYKKVSAPSKRHGAAVEETAKCRSALNIGHKGAAVTKSAEAGSGAKIDKGAILNEIIAPSNPK